jgi:hypothetical protein
MLRRKEAHLHQHATMCKSDLWPLLYLVTAIKSTRWHMSKIPILSATDRLANL